MRAGATPVTSLGLVFDEHGTAQGAMDIGRQFGDQNQFGLRVNAAGGRIGSVIDGVDGNRQFGSAAFDWRINSRLTLRADVEQYHKEVVEQAGITRLAAVNGVIALPALPDPTKRLGPLSAVFDAKVTNTQVRADYALTDTWALMVEAGHSEGERDRRLASFSNYNVRTGAGRITGNDQHLEQSSDLFRTELFGTFATGGVQHELTLGAARSDKSQTRSTSAPTAARPRCRTSTARCRSARSRPRRCPRGRPAAGSTAKSSASTRSTASR
jgi:iron complex outermembrane receptor protein